MKKTWDMALENEAYIIDRRHYYHENAEPSMEEWETTKAISADLTALGIEHRTFADHPGVLGVIRGGKPGKGIMLRADIDALTGVVEATGLPYASKNPKCSHACGHDTHVAVLLGAAKMLNEIKDELCGTVNLCFEPGEEVVLGVHDMIREGCLEGMDMVFGMHTWSHAPNGVCSVSEGNLMAAGGMFTITVEGYSAHGSSPHEGKDAIIAAASIAMNIQTFVSRHNNPLNPLVITIGTIHGGARWNVISNKVVMEGTIRTFDREIRKNIQAELSEIIENTARALGCTAKLEYEELWPATINSDKALVDLTRNAAIGLFGSENVISQPPVMGGESFSYYLEERPGVYCYMGCKDEAHPYGNHHEKFDVDETILKKSAALYVQVARDFLKEEA